MAIRISVFEGRCSLACPVASVCGPLKPSEYFAECVLTVGEFKLRLSVLRIAVPFGRSTNRHGHCSNMATALHFSSY